ncbi:polysaccharide deacetylase family protein [Streptacidiphilus sp. PAMC 29251]
MRRLTRTTGGCLRRTPWALMYHSVDDFRHDPFRLTVSPRRFDQQMRWLSRSGRRGVSMVELLRAWDRGTAANLVGLTFDDGYADFSEKVLPILRSYDFTATVFVVAGLIGDHNSWDAGAPAKPLLTARQLRSLAGSGMEVGSHGETHRHMVGLDPAALDLEVSRSRATLEDLLQEPVRGFCYPYGEFEQATVDAVGRAGYQYAAAVGHGIRCGRRSLPRSYVGERDARWRLLAKRLRHRLRDLASSAHCPPLPAD